MNSARLQSFSQDLFTLMRTRNWPVSLALSARSLERGLALAERELFAATTEQPELARQPIGQKPVGLLLARFWLCFYALGLYAMNLLLIATIVVRRVRWRGECGESGLCALAPPGRTFETYRTIIRKHGGVSICIVGPRSWRQVEVTTGDEHVRFETLLTTSPLRWIPPLMFLMREVSFVSSSVVFESEHRAKSVARFLYLLLKQAVMARRAEEICGSFQRSVAVLFSSETLSLSLLDKVRASRHRAIHHLHGAILKDNMLAEPPLADALIVSSSREKQIFSEYPAVDAFPATIPFQMHDEVSRLKSIQTATPDFDILIIASFELPFLQNETYHILCSCMDGFRHSRILLRHHPRAPESSRQLLNRSIPFSKISRTESIVSDINSARVIVCCAIDPLAVCLHMKKPTVFLPMTDGDYAKYTRPFVGRLSNLWCPDSSPSMSRDLVEALSMHDWHPPDDYESTMTELVGSTDFGRFGHALGAAMGRDSAPDRSSLQEPEDPHD